MEQNKDVPSDSGVKGKSWGEVGAMNMLDLLSVPISGNHGTAGPNHEHQTQNITG